MLGHQLRLGGAKRDHRHPLRQSDLDSSGIEVFIGQHVENPRRKRRILQTEVFVADLRAALHGAHVDVLLRKASVRQRQLDLLLRRDLHLQQRLVVFLIVADGEGRLLPVCPHIGNFVAGIDAEGHRLRLAGAVFQLVGRLALHRAGAGIGENLRRPAGAEHLFEVGNLQKGHHRLVRVAVVDQRLGRIGRQRTAQQQRRRQRAVKPARAVPQRAEHPLSILPDAQVGHRPHPGQGQQPAQPHIGHRAEDAEVGKVVGQRPDAGVEPAELPVIRPDRQAQGCKPGQQHQRQVQPPGELVGRACGQNPKRQRKAGQQQVAEQVVRRVKDLPDHPPADGEPDRHHQQQRQHRRCYQRRQPHQRHRQRRDRRVGQRLHPAAGGAVQLKDGEDTKQNASHRAARDGGIGQVLGQHGAGGRRTVQRQPHHWGEHRQQDNQPGQTALQQPFQLQPKQPHRPHCTASPAIK